MSKRKRNSSLTLTVNSLKDTVLANFKSNLKLSAPKAAREKPKAVTDDTESLDAWGFRDSRFELLEDGSVYLHGSRYPLGQQKLPSLVPWIEGLMNIKLEANDRRESVYPPRTHESRLGKEELQAIEKIFSKEQISLDPAQRLRHGHGHTQEEIYAINYGDGFSRIPDAVIYPESESQIVSLIELAIEKGFVIIPYGGGTSVSEALRCPKSENRPILSVDMKQMNRIVWIDAVNRMACIEAGAVGRDIVEELRVKGFTLGHEPDSIEFSTMGGWIATHSSGMKKNRYGNIEDIVLDMRVATPKGILSRESLAPRESIGIDLKRMIFGSEGNLGIITQAVVKIHPLPEVQRYGSFVFPSFEDGVAFMYDVAQSGIVPASVRLVDNPQFQFGQALKPAAKDQAHIMKSKLEKAYVTKVRGMKTDSMVACTIVYEGSRQDVERERASLKKIASKHHGIDGGAENGSRGYQLTFGIAYIRDFIMRHHLIAESFETSVPWNRVVELCDRVKRRVQAEHAARHLEGKPFVSCRVTQIYPTGVCIYFYLAIYAKGIEDPSAVFSEIEHAAREEILAAGGSLSHHHGIGKIRAGFLPKIMSGAHLDIKKEIKRAVDPKGIFGVNNQDIDGHAHE